jgi:hypothetical protein
MAVYIDDMKIKYRGMYMCHMIADRRIELFKMKHKIFETSCYSSLLRLPLDVTRFGGSLALGQNL